MFFDSAKSSVLKVKHFLIQGSEIRSLTFGFRKKQCFQNTTLINPSVRNSDPYFLIPQKTVFSKHNTSKSKDPKFGPVLFDSAKNSVLKT